MCNFFHKRRKNVARLDNSEIKWQIWAKFRRWPRSIHLRFSKSENFARSVRRYFEMEGMVFILTIYTYIVGPHLAEAWFRSNDCIDLCLHGPAICLHTRILLFHPSDFCVDFPESTCLLAVKIATSSSPLLLQMLNMQSRSQLRRAMHLDGLDPILITFVCSMESKSI